MLISRNSDPRILAEKLGLGKEELLEEALTHPANKRMAWLGDAVLYLAVTEHLYTTSKDPASKMDPRRQGTINNFTLRRTAADQIHLSDYIGVPTSEVDPGAEGILATAFEALIGTIYLEKGYRAAASFVVKLFSEIEQNIPVPP